MNAPVPDTSARAATTTAHAAPPELFPESLEFVNPVDVSEGEYRRLLGYPPGHRIGERAGELAAATRAWFAAHARPWVYARETFLQLDDTTLRLDGTAFDSPRLHAHFRRHGATRALVVAVSAGAAAEEQAHTLWQEGKPDEYFFLEMYASAAVEHLVATLSSCLCAVADREALVAIPHYSPGYAGWDVAEQPRLFTVLARRQKRAFPESLTVLPSGMLRPKKSLLAVVGLATRPANVAAALDGRRTPCLDCSWTPCAYRRAPYRHDLTANPPASAAPVASTSPAAQSSGAPAPRYTTNPRALAKWARERLQLETRDDGGVVATFRFEGTTCANTGHPLAFDYRIVLGPADQGRVVEQVSCTPAPGDGGYTQMCAYLRNSDALMAAIAAEQPLVGQPLDQVFVWPREARPAGCLCEADSRTHKWVLALETLHFALHPRTDARAADVTAGPAAGARATASPRSLVTVPPP